MKKLLAVLCALSLFLSQTACGEENQDTPTCDSTEATTESTTLSTEETQCEETIAETTSEEEPEPTEDSPSVENDTNAGAAQVHNHRYSSKVTKTATCTEKGTTTYVCSCGKSYTESIEAAGHSYTSKITRQPTCTAEGQKTFTCACGSSYTEAISATGHTWDNWSPVSKEEDARSCTACQESERREIQIEITSTEQVYALGRILQINGVKRDHIYKDTAYTVKNDLNLFSYPAELTTDSEKLTYLQTASYVLMNDISLVLQKCSGLNYFTGIGSTNYPFMGKFDGNGHTVTLTAPETLDLGNVSDYGTGLFDEVKNAKINNVSVCVESDIVVAAPSKGGAELGVIAGHATSSEFSDCSVRIRNSAVGVDCAQASGVPYSVGGIAGFSALSTYKNCSVVMENAALVAKGTQFTNTRKYGVVTVGGIIGFSNPGSSNSDNIGRLGNQLYNCSLTANNDAQQDVLLACAENCEEATAGGIVGCTFNNLLIKNCSVNVSKGNISAVKTGEQDSATKGSAAGGIIGRMEHTAEVTGCSVTGDYLTILAESPNNVTAAGGIAGIDMGPYHRDIDTINSSHFDGSGTSQIKVKITTSDTLETSRVIGAGGVVGVGSYIVSDCSVKNVTVANDSTDIGNPTSYVGEIAGYIVLKKADYIKGIGYNWVYKTYFKPRTTGLFNCAAQSVVIEKSDNVQIQNLGA